MGRECVYGKATSFCIYLADEPSPTTGQPDNVRKRTLELTQGRDRYLQNTSYSIKYIGHVHASKTLFSPCFTKTLNSDYLYVSDGECIV